MINDIANKENTNTTNNFFKIMNKSMKPSAAAQRPLTEEEKKSQIMRAFMQKRASLAEGILFNLCQAMDYTNKEGKLMVDMAIEMADHLMEKLYGAKPQE